MADTELLPYRELADLVDHLPLLLREARRQHRLTMKQAGDQIGVAASTVLRLESGQGAVLSTVVAVLRWLDRTSPDPDTDPDTRAEDPTGSVPERSDEGTVS